jgi:hypothetical protein
VNIKDILRQIPDDLLDRIALSTRVVAHQQKINPCNDSVSAMTVTVSLLYSEKGNKNRRTVRSETILMYAENKL